MRAGAQRRQSGLHRPIVALSLHARKSLKLAALAVTVHLEQRHSDGSCFGEVVHPDDDPALLLDLALIAGGAVGDLALEISVFDGGQHAPQGFNFAEHPIGVLFHPGGQGLDEIRAAKRINRVGHTTLVGDDLLGAQGNLNGTLAGQGQRFVERVGVQRLSAAEDGRQGLDGHPDHVDLGLLGGQRHARGLGVSPHQPRALILRPKRVAHLAGPDPARGPVFGDFLEEVVVGVEEKRQARGEQVDIEPARHRPTHILKPIGQGEGQLLGGGGPRLADVIAAD